MTTLSIHLLDGHLRDGNKAVLAKNAISSDIPAYSSWFSTTQFWLLRPKYNNENLNLLCAEACDYNCTLETSVTTVLLKPRLLNTSNGQQRSSHKTLWTVKTMLLRLRRFTNKFYTTTVKTKYSFYRFSCDAWISFQQPSFTMESTNPRALMVSSIKSCFSMDVVSVARNAAKFVFKFVVKFVAKFYK